MQTITLESLLYDNSLSSLMHEDMRNEEFDISEIVTEGLDILNDIHTISMANTVMVESDSSFIVYESVGSKIRDGLKWIWKKLKEAFSWLRRFIFKIGRKIKNLFTRRNDDDFANVMDEMCDTILKHAEDIDDLENEMYEFVKTQMQDTIDTLNDVKSKVNSNKNSTSDDVKSTFSSMAKELSDFEKMYDEVMGTSPTQEYFKSKAYTDFIHAAKRWAYAEELLNKDEFNKLIDPNTVKTFDVNEYVERVNSAISELNAQVVLIKVTTKTIENVLAIDNEKKFDAYYNVIQTHINEFDRKVQAFEKLSNEASDEELRKYKAASDLLKELTNIAASASMRAGTHIEKIGHIADNINSRKKDMDNKINKIASNLKDL